MRNKFLIFTLIFCATVVIFAQTNQPISKQNDKVLEVDVEEGVTHPQILTECELSELPWEEPPQLTMQNALPFAEKYLKDKNIDTSKYYLLLAKPGQTREHSWFFRWIRKDWETSKETPYIDLIVSMDGKVTQSE